VRAEMIIETLICEARKSTLRIESDDLRFIEKHKKQFAKQHEKCVKKNKERHHA
jgi:hypothetical protein